MTTASSHTLLQFNATYSHQLICTDGLQQSGNESILRALGKFAKPETKLLIVMESGLLGLGFENLPAQLKQQALAATNYYQLVEEVLYLPGGEVLKESSEGVLTVCAAIEKHKIDRHSIVMAIGGGAFLDVVSFAASIAHRGVQLIRVPTTVLSQADSGVGVKSAINAFGKKNFLGAFAVPLAVINDAQFLRTTDANLIRQGLAEVIKVALIKSATLFEQIEALGTALLNPANPDLVTVVNASALLHLNHICQGGDPFEQGSSRPLDFGHWSAHKAEGLAKHQVAHGEAVAAGLHLDCLYSYKIGWLPEGAYLRVKRLLLGLGYNLCPPGFGLQKKENCEVHPLVAGLEEFREHLGGRLTILMLQGVGQPFNIHEFDQEVLQNCLEEIQPI